MERRSPSPSSPHRVVIVGGGFGGLHAAQALRGAAADVTLVDRRNFHLFQPLLYQVATGGLSPGDICSPLRHVLRRQRNARVLLGEVLDVDVVRRQIVLSDGRIDYDTLIVAAGSRHHYFGHAEWEQRAPGLKTVEDATELRRRILLAFETAEREPDHARRLPWLTFVVVGGGPTGVELAGALGEIANDTLRNDFRAIRPSEATILLVEPEEQVLPVYPPELAAKAKEALEKLGATVCLGALVTSVDEASVTVQWKESGRDERIPTRTVLWAAGIQASGLGRVIAAATGADTDRSGRLVVGPDLGLPQHPEILVVGDMAHFAHQGGSPLLALAPVAMAQGRYAARLIRDRLEGRATEPFHYRDKGMMATIGRSKAVVNLGWLRFSGLLAWVTWLFIHLLYLVGFENRLLVLIQWAWSYVTHNRGARLITGENPLPLPLSDAACDETRLPSRAASSP
jgi:NADH:quinone reductase (non-electrogenic)